MLSLFIDWILHLDTHLAALAASHGFLVYLALFAIIFIETGVVILPFLPGDSLLFVAGTLAAQQILSLPVLIPLLALAAIAGDALNYAIGWTVRTRAIDARQLPLLKQEHLAQAHAFFERHGPKTIVLARFVPIVRTLAPFVAALSKMRYSIFMRYNSFGGLLGAVSLSCAGYALGSVPWVSNNLNAVLLGIVVLSILPSIIGKLKASKPAYPSDKQN